MNRRSQRVQPINQRGRWGIRSSSEMQYTCEVLAAVVSVQFRSCTILSSGTRLPAPHQAAMMTSGSSRPMSSTVHCAPGLPMNSPPAARTSSSTHGCEAIIGLPHFRRRYAYAAGQPQRGARLRPPLASRKLPARPGRWRRHKLRWLLCRCRYRRASEGPARELERQLSISPRAILAGKERRRSQDRA